MHYVKSLSLPSETSNVVFKGTARLDISNSCKHSFEELNILR